MTMGPPFGTDVWTSSIKQLWASSQKPQAIQNGGMRVTDLMAMGSQGKTLSGRGAFHVGFLGFNRRRVPLDDVNFRHALAHLVPKDQIIGNLFQYLAVRLDTPVPPTQAMCYNSQVDPHPYSLAEAQNILALAGYQQIGGIWFMPDGSPIPPLTVYCPPVFVAPTSNTIATMFVASCAAIGLASLVVLPLAFPVYVDLVYESWNFDIFFSCWDVGRFCTHLWSQFNSENNYLGSENPFGIDYPDLDAATDILWRSLDYDAKIMAAQHAQELIMGGTITDPLPQYVAPSDPRSQAIPIVPVYSRNAYDAQDPRLGGAVNMFGYGINNMWTWMNIHWDTPGGLRPGSGLPEVWPILDDFPEPLNPLRATTTYAWTFIDSVLDGLIAVNPYTHQDEPWLAVSWSYVPVPGGMDVTFNLRLTDSTGAPIQWQDGDPVSASDVKFAWDFLSTWQIPNYWDAFKYYQGADIIDADTIVAHMSTTSQWCVYSLAGVAYMLPPQVWTQNPLTGAGWTFWEIVNFDPSSYPYPLPGNVNPGPTSLPTQLFGTGPFILNTPWVLILVLGRGQLISNWSYWMTTADIMNTIENMFWRAGDVVDNDKIDVSDMATIGLAFLTVPGDPLWNPNADFTGPGYGPPDGQVDIFDLAVAGRNFGETETVPYEYATPP